MKILKPKERSGIYCIMNAFNNKKYIGSSINMYQRLQKHRSMLRKNYHQNRKLQNSWNKYSEEKFECYILEYCSEDLLEEKEQYYIDNLNPDYNITKIVERNILSKESRLLQSETRKRRIKSGEIKLYTKELFKYDLNGNFICKYNSLNEASIDSNISKSSIFKFLKGQYNKAGNNLWSTEFKEFLPKYVKAKKDCSYNNKSIQVLDYYTKKIVMKFDSIKECANYYNMHSPSITYAIKVQQKFKKQYMLVYSTA